MVSVVLRVSFQNSFQILVTSCRTDGHLRQEAWCRNVERDDQFDVMFQSKQCNRHRCRLHKTQQRFDIHSPHSPRFCLPVKFGEIVPGSLLLVLRAPQRHHLFPTHQCFQEKLQSKHTSPFNIQESTLSLSSAWFAFRFIIFVPLPTLVASSKYF